MSESPVSTGRRPVRARMARSATSPSGGASSADATERRRLLQALTGLKKGDFSVRLEVGL